MPAMHLCGHRRRRYAAGAGAVGRPADVPVLIAERTGGAAIIAAAPGAGGWREEVRRWARCSLAVRPEQRAREFIERVRCVLTAGVEARNTKDRGHTVRHNHSRSRCGTTTAVVSRRRRKSFP